jgi:glycosyltransferase involved in cell wall biosynthesis
MTSLANKSVLIRRPVQAPGPIDSAALPHTFTSSDSLAAESSTFSSPAKPRVLILPNAASWIIGQMALHVIRRFSDRYEFWFLTDKMLRLRADLVRTLLPSIDFIFPLGDKGFHLLRQAAGPATQLPPSILWLHHVTTWNPAMLEAMQASSELIACTETWKHQVHEQAGPDLPVTVVPHGVDAQALHRVRSQRQHFRIPQNSFALGFVGSKISNYDAGRKGLDTLHAILRSANKNIPNLHISFLGLGWKQEVEDLRAQGISANYVGFIPESQLAAFYSSVDVYLLTSRVEGGPCTVLEAMACETPVVTTRVGLVPEVVVDGVTGFSAEVNDAPALTAHLQSLANSPVLCRQIGAAARATVSTHRSWDETLRQLEIPFSRMTARATPKLHGATPATHQAAANLTRAVHTVDDLLWGIASCGQRVISPAVALRLIRSCWENYSAADILRGLALIARLNFRPATMRKLLSQTPSGTSALVYPDAERAGAPGQQFLEPISNDVEAPNP